MSDISQSLLDITGHQNHEDTDPGIKVFTRIRPNFKNECVDGKESIPAIEVLDRQTLVFRHVKKNSSIKENKFYTFSRVFDSRTTTEHIFNEVLKDRIFESAFGGKNVLILAGGHERSGKSHTILGHLAQPGLILQSVRDLLTKIQDKAFRGLTTMNARFLEFFGEKFIDLCGGKANIGIQQAGTLDERKVLGCTSFNVRDFLSFVRIFKSALRISSGIEDFDLPNFSNIDGEGIRRSHFIVEIEIKQEEMTNGGQFKTYSSKICFVDLAHMDSQYKAMDVENSVNMSLHNLSKCLNKMRDVSKKIFKNNHYIQFDRSAFTLFLQSYLQGVGSEVVYFNHIASAENLREDIRLNLKMSRTISEIIVPCQENTRESRLNANKYRILMDELSSINTQIIKNLSLKDYKMASSTSSTSEDPERHRKTPFMICCIFLASILIKGKGVESKLKSCKEKQEQLCEDFLKMCNETLEFVIKSSDLREFYVVKYSNYLINDFLEKAKDISHELKKTGTEINKLKYTLNNLNAEIPYFKRRIIESEDYEFSGNEKTFLGKLTNWVCEFIAFADTLYSGKELYYRSFFSWAEAEELLAKISREPLSSIAVFLDEYKKVMPNASLSLLIKQKREDIEKLLSKERHELINRNNNLAAVNYRREGRPRKLPKEKILPIGRLEISDSLNNPAIAYSLSDIDRSRTIKLPKLPLFETTSPSARNSLTHRSIMSLKAKGKKGGDKFPLHSPRFSEPISEIINTTYLDGSSPKQARDRDSLSELMLLTKIKGQQYLLPSINTVQTSIISSKMLTEEIEEIKPEVMALLDSKKKSTKEKELNRTLEPKSLEKEHPEKDYFSKMNLFLNNYEKTQFGERFVISKLLDKGKKQSEILEKTFLET